jgi:REP element-mobilizing transposase RayT
MARPLRIEIPGGWYHVTARGNERRAIWRDDRDRRHFLALLEKFVERFRVSVHAYVLMDNHYHLLLRTGESNLSRAMQWLGVSYTVYFNRRHRRAGHLFQGRFHALLMEEDVAWEVSRYVHLNPIRLRAFKLDKTEQQRSRSGLIERPDATLVRQRLQHLRQYRWSSFRAYVGREPASPWLTCDHILGLAGETPKGRAARQHRYGEFIEEAVREGLLPSPWERLQGQLLLGSASFVEQMRRLARGDAKEQFPLRHLRERPSFKAVVAAVEKAKGEPWVRWRDRHGDWGRDAVLWLARKRCAMTLSELGQAIGGADYRCVSAAVGRFERQLHRDRQLLQTLATIERQL